MSRFLHGPGRTGYIAPVYVGGMDQTPPDQGTQPRMEGVRHTNRVVRRVQEEVSDALDLVPDLAENPLMRAVADGAYELTPEEAEEILAATRSFRQRIEQEEAEATQRRIDMDKENFEPSDADLREIEAAKQTAKEHQFDQWQKATEKVLGRILLKR